MINAKIQPLNIIDQRWLAAGLFTGIILLASTYVFLVNNSVFNIVARENLLEEINRLETELVVLETRYIELSSQITLSFADTLGFVDASREVTFVKESEGASRLSLIDNEI